MDAIEQVPQQGGNAVARMREFLEAVRAEMRKVTLSITST